MKLTSIRFYIFVTVIDELTRKESIVREAARLFRVMGYSATSMRDLAGAVGMEAASLYNHIANKQELLQIICMEVAHRHSDSLQEVVSMNLSPLSSIEMLVRHHIRINTRVPEMAAVANDQWRHLLDVPRQEFLDNRNAYEKQLKVWIAAAMADGSIRPSDTHVVLYTLLSSLQWLHHWYRHERPIGVHELEEEMVELIMNGLKK